VPGWSSYLHPYGEDQLVAVGMGGAEPGIVTDLSLSLFDVADLAAPALVHQIAVGTGGSWSDALWDPHAFLLYNNTIAMPMYAWEAEKAWSGLAVYGVDPVAGFTFRGQIEHGDLSHACADDPANCAVMAWMRRSVVIGDTLYSVSDLGVKASSLLDPSVELGRFAFTSADNPNP
jgi:hypothetical protein